MIATSMPKTERAAADTASPARNFTLSVAERVNAAIAGAPAYARRLRAIEDLQARLAGRLADLTSAKLEVRRAFAADLASLNDLIDRHNRFYPIERNLPSDPRTGAVVDHGRAWRPLDPVTIERLRADSRDAGS